MLLDKLFILVWLIAVVNGYLSPNQTDFLQKWKKRGKGKYDYYMLTRIYPTAVCRADDDAVPDSCEVPSGISSWAVHGLWPERKDGSYPQFCDGNPKQFDPNLIEDIKVELTHVWPNLLTGKGPEDFWKHEYEKHGTCAQTDSRFSTELLYFKSTMELNGKFSVEEALKKGDIVTRNEPYSVQQVQNALNQHLGNGHYVQMHCLKDKKTGQQLLADTRLCVTRDWDTTDCPKEQTEPPVVEILGKGYPIPSYQPCRGDIVFLEEVDKAISCLEIDLDSSLKNPIHSEMMFYVNPLINILPNFLSGNSIINIFAVAGLVSFAIIFWHLRREERIVEQM